jgi:hypothetical protein
MRIRTLFIGLFALVATAGLAGCDSGGTTGIGTTGDSTTVAFTETAEVVDKASGSYTATIVVQDPGFKEIPVEVQVASNSTAALGEDVTGLSETTSITFPERTTSGDTRTVSFDLVDDIEGGDQRRRVLSLELSSASDEVGLGDPSTLTLTIEERLTTQEVRDSVTTGDRALVDGTVTRVTPEGAYLQDDQGALFLDGSGVPGEMAQGDEVRVDGQTGFEDGAFHLSNVDLDASTVLSQDNALPDPHLVDFDTLETNGENLESELVTVQAPFTIERGGDEVFQETEYSIEDTSIPLVIPAGSGLVGDTIPTPLASFQGVVDQSNGGGPGADEPDRGYRLLGVVGDDVQGAEFTIAEARERGTETTVVIEGTVTRAFGSYARIQDESGPTGASGIVIRQTGGENADAFQQDIADEDIRRGTQLRITGTTSAFAGLFQINNDDLSNYEIVGQTDAVPDLQTVTLADLQGSGGEDHESELLRVEDLTFPDASGTFESGTTYTVENADGTIFEFRVQDDAETNIIGEPIPDETFTYEGVLGQFNNFSGNDEGYQFIPIQPSDIQE